MDKILQWWMNLVSAANEYGIPLPMARDPKTGKGSLSVSMVQVSFGLCVIPVILMTGTVLAKLTGVFALNDANSQQLMNAFSASIQLYIVSFGGYLGRKLQRDSKGAVNMDGAEKEEETSK